MDIGDTLDTTGAPTRLEAEGRAEGKDPRWQLD